MNILVTGGAGYIGSHMVRMLQSHGHTVVVVDTLEHGNVRAISTDTRLYEKNVADLPAVTEILQKHEIDTVIHFAGYISVEESTRKPGKYMENNLVAAVSLLNAMEQAAVSKIIFSSTAAVYGNPLTSLIPEDHRKQPTSPYGLSKLFFEDVLSFYSQKGTIRSISLRYFNASGASADGQIGEAHKPETHIIPRAISAALSEKPEFTLYGTDYDTPDGTCVRDYIHVEDLCAAHVSALDALAGGHQSDVFNVGTGVGISNRQVAETVSRVTGVDIGIAPAGRRDGDPATLIADPAKIQRVLGWKPKKSDIETIVRSAWDWHKAHPEGYGNNAIR